MTVVTEKLNVIRVEHPPHGTTTFNRDFLKGLKKEDFDKKFKGRIDIKEVWKAIKKYTR